MRSRLRERIERLPEFASPKSPMGGPSSSSPCQNKFANDTALKPVPNHPDFEGQRTAPH